MQSFTLYNLNVPLMNLGNLVIYLMICIIRSTKPDTFQESSTAQHRESTRDGIWIGPSLGVIPACILGCIFFGFIFLHKKSKIIYGLSKTTIDKFNQSRSK